MGRALRACALAAAAGAAAGAAHAQNLEFERDRARTMLTKVREDLEKNYYDPTFHGVDLAARFKAADAKLPGADSLGQMFAIVAQAVLDLGDSHTLFLPPQRSVAYEYGWQARVFGEDCYLTAVRPGSDAEAKGLKPGDRLVAIAGIAASRQTLWKLRYLFYSIRPVLAMTMIVQPPGGQPRQVEVRARTSPDRRVLDVSDESSIDFWELIRAAEREAREEVHHYYEMGDDVLLWHMPAFDLGNEGLAKLIGKAAKRKALVIDMRGNTGGRVDLLERLIWRTFPGDVRLGEIRERKGKQPWLVKAQGKPFAGSVVVLVDSDSASASEIYARALQLEKRGVVIGDRTSGRVMISRYRNYQIGFEQVLYYGANLTVGGVTMRDGQMLEGQGVVPDEVLLPTAEDLAAGRDPVLARALSIAGVERTPEAAGKLFPIQWSGTK